MNIPKPEDLTTQEKIFFVNLYFAKKHSDDPAYRNRGSYYRVLSRRYDIKEKTLSNNQDSLDPYFDNNRKGWHQRTIEKKNKLLAKFFEAYEQISDYELDKLVAAIMEISPFYSIIVGDPATVASIFNDQQDIVIVGLNTLQDKLHRRQKVFIVLGESSDPEADWGQGLIAFGYIAQPPYDIAETGYKIRVTIAFRLEKPVQRADLVHYFNSFNVTGIGPMTHQEPEQAISELSEDKAFTLVRAILDNNPGREKALKEFFGDDFMGGVKNEEVYLLSRSQTWADKLSEPTEEEIPDMTLADHFDPDHANLSAGMFMEEAPFATAVNFINTDKHLILTGPPGTGKTTIAERLAAEAARTGYNQGYIAVTATAEWSTFDTIGGYMPGPDGQLDFQEGIILRSIRENKWIILDEINRAEIDKAFGPLFTLLSGKGVDLPFRSGGQWIRLRVSPERRSYFDKVQGIYHAGKNWRIIGTMNTYDKNSLFTLSYAFMRRFAFVNIPIPSATKMELITNGYQTQDGGVPPEQVQEFIGGVLQHSPRPLGPAIVLDLLRYLEAAGFEGFCAGLCGIVIPQLEGIAQTAVRKFFLAVSIYLNGTEPEELKDYLNGFFELDTHYLTTAPETDTDN